VSSIDPEKLSSSEPGGNGSAMRAGIEIRFPHVGHFPIFPAALSGATNVPLQLSHSILIGIPVRFRKNFDNQPTLKSSS
jgi:hypothetical protein